MRILNPDKCKGKFFEIVGTTAKSQVAVMTLKPGEDSGPEDIHEGDQIAYIVEGRMRAIVDGSEAFVEKGQAVIIPGGASHHLYNAGDSELFVLNFYSLPAY